MAPSAAPVRNGVLVHRSFVAENVEFMRLSVLIQAFFLRENAGFMSPNSHNVDGSDLGTAPFAEGYAYIDGDRQETRP